MRLSEIREGLSEYAARFDAALLAPRDAACVVEYAAAIKNMAATVEAAARRGELSAQQVAVISDAVATNPSAAGRLVDAAGKQSLGELRDEAARTKAAGIDLEARRRRIHERRSLRSWTDGEGVANLLLRDNPERVAEIMAIVEPVRDELFRAARKEGRREPSEAYAADALLEVARRATDGGGVRQPVKAKILFRSDLDVVLRGHPIEGEVCELVGYGPVPVSTIHDMIECGNPVIAAIAAKGKSVVGVAPPEPSPDRPSTVSIGVAQSDVCSGGLPCPRSPADRPRRGLVQDQVHAPRPPRPALPPSPRSQDPRQLGARSGPRETRVRPAWRPPTSPPPSPGPRSADRGVIVMNRGDRMDTHFSAAFEPLHQVIAPDRAQYRELLVRAGRWGLERGFALRPDLVALICAGSNFLGVAEQGEVTWWTRRRVNDLLMRGIFDWCSVHHCLVPDGIPEAVWWYLGFLSETGRLDKSSEPIRILREPLMCYGGLDHQGRALPDAEPLDPCRCYQPYESSERREWPPHPEVPGRQ